MKKILISLLTLLVLTGCDSKTSDEAKPTVKVEEKNEVISEDKVEEKTFEEIVVLDNEYLKFTITDIDPEGFWGFALKVLVENKTDKDIMVSWDGVSVNGFMCDPYWATDIYANKKYSGDISWFDTTLEEKGIKTIEDIEFTVKVTDNDTWNNIFEGNYSITLK